MGNRSSTGDATPPGSPTEAQDPSRVSLAYKELRALPSSFLESEDLAKVCKLDLSHNKLTDACLHQLAALESLESLVLDCNRFQTVFLPPLPKLTFLTLNSNNISDLENLIDILLSRCPGLRSLSLIDNPCCPNFEEQQRRPAIHHRYRLFIVGHMKNLHTLDFVRVTDSEKIEGQQLLEELASGAPLFPENDKKKPQKGDKKSRKSKKKKAKKEKKRGDKEKYKDKEKEKEKDDQGSAKAVGSSADPPVQPQDDQPQLAALLPCPEKLREAIPDHPDPPPPPVHPPPPPPLESSGSEWSESDSSGSELDRVLDDHLRKSGIIRQPSPVQPEEAAFG
eukprot:Sspe_Gene.79416::Locus_49805_Transcript_1_1_Confidence_1.000_Length_1056::g.79416::m.79416